MIWLFLLVFYLFRIGLIIENPEDIGNYSHNSFYFFGM